MIFSGVIIKAQAVAIAALFVVCTIFYFLWSSASNNVEVLEQNQMRLESTIIYQKATIDKLIANNKDITENLSDLVRSNESASRILSEKIEEINQLRIKEAQLALQNPYQRGSVAAIRFNDILRNISKAGDRDSDRDSTSTSNNTPSTSKP